MPTLSVTTSSAGATVSAAGVSPLLKPIRRDKFKFWQAHHLLNRAGFGGTAEQVSLLAGWGPEKAVEHLVYFTGTEPQPVAAEQFDAAIMAPITAEERGVYRRAREAQREDIVEKFRQRQQQRQRADRAQIREMQKWWFTRFIETPRPLEEKMTLFYHGHFATGYRKIENSFHLFQQNQLFRHYALGNFGDLVFQIVRDPAMIAYLDNHRSSRNAPNENLARELMELFTLGEGVVYQEQDIKEGARALTGFTFNHNEFVFNQRGHDDGRKTIFGQTGRLSGDDFVKLILSRREVSEFICLKLYRFFVNDLPAGPTRKQQAVIKVLAKELRAAQYEVAPVLKMLFRSQHFYEEANLAAQIKSPVQLVVQGIRSLNTPVADLTLLIEACGLMGQTIFEPPNVKGWDGGRSWINTSTFFVRQNVLTHLLTGRMPHGYQSAGTTRKYDPLPLLKSLTKGPHGYDPTETIQYLAHFLLGRPCSAAGQETLSRFVKANGGKITPELTIGLLCLITTMPEYQLC